MSTTGEAGGWAPPADRRTLGDVIRDGAARWGDRPAFVVDDVSVTYQEADARSNAVANALLALGVRKGDRVAMLMENCVELIDVWFACGKIGAIEVPINTAYRGEYLRHQLLNCDPAALVIDDRYGDRIPADLRLPSLRALYVRETAHDATGAPDLGVPVHPASDLLAASSEPPALDDPPRHSDPLSIVYTGGTTGPSKGVVIPHRYMINASDTTFRWRGGVEGDVVYSPLPLYHFNAHIITILGPFLHGGCGALDTQFSASRFWDRVDRFGASHIAILGSQITMVWNQPADERDGSHGVKVLIGAPITPEMRVQWKERFGVSMSQGFALTEACPITSSPIWDPSPPGSSGRPVPTVQVRLFDENDEEVATGAVGEICVRPNEPFVIFSGYFRDPAATAEVWRNGWFHTGDLGRFDEGGFLYFVDRKKDYLRRRGENVSSFEVERTVTAFPGVAEVACTGVPSRFTEDDCMVTVVPKPGVTIDPWELIRHCVDNMPFFAVPRYVRIVDELPRSPVGKILKYRIREDGVPPGTFDLEAEGYRVNRDGLVPLQKVGGA